MIQFQAALVSLLLSLIVIAIALFVTRRASSRKVDAPATVYRVRRYYSAALIAGLAALLFLTLARTPYVRSSLEIPEESIDVVGWMWGWDFRVDGQIVGLPLVLPARKLVEFAVTSKDVNHGFGIYDVNGRLVTQTQAMPGYVNHLRVRFEEPGTYHILCLEYCGAGHPIMMAEISVR